MPTETMLYAQSGGPTAVINASAAAVIGEARRRGVRVLAARHGILGVLREELIDCRRLSMRNIEALGQTPGAAFGSCRFKLKGEEQHGAEHQRLLDVFRAHNVRWFLYNGGNDSADTALKVSGFAKRLGRPITAVAIPKTIDNDLAVTDCSPGFGSVAKFTAVAIREASLDVASMANSSTKVFLMEVMGRNAGWIAAAAGLAGNGRDQAPHIILFPERAHDQAAFLARVKETVERVGWCTVVAAEGLRDKAGKFLADAGSRDAFGHKQLGGVAPVLAASIKAKLGYKCHFAIPDYLQRAARHVASAVDAEQARAVGKAAVDCALRGQNGVMPVIVRSSDAPYRWRVEPAPLARVANREKKLPKGFVSRDGMAITAAARRYLEPLIRGEAPMKWTRDGLPDYFEPELTMVRRKLPPFEAS